MKQTWLIVAAILLLPLTTSAHPGALDEKSCHFCTVDCEKYGLKVGDYVCHIENDREANFSYTQFQTLQRHLKRLTIPKLRQLAIIIRKRDVIRNRINAPDKACRPTIGPDGNQKAPLLAKHTGLGDFGELLTAFACKNSLEFIRWVDADGNIPGELLLTLKKTPLPTLALKLKHVGFECVNLREAHACTEWTLNIPLIPANSLKPLLSFSSHIRSVHCADCDGMYPIAPEPEPVLDEINTGQPQGELIEQATDQFETPEETGSGEVAL